MTAFYNEIEPYAAQWLRNLIDAGHIAPGVVDTRSIEEIEPSELKEFTQCHFFAGIGVWSYALRRAGWPDDRPIWTGSCPCQPFSAAGRGKGADDERHLWPAFSHLIRTNRPDIVIGEQVASRDGLGWLDLVSADMEGAGYAFGAVDLCAASVGAPHIRQRLWFVGVADALPARRAERWAVPGRRPATGSGEPVGVADAARQLDNGRPRLEGQRDGYSAESRQRKGSVRPASETSEFGGLAYSGRPGPTNGFWRDADWLFCRDGKWRPVEPGTFPLANGASARVGRLRAYGNAIVASVAETFIRAVKGILDGTP